MWLNPSKEEQKKSHDISCEILGSEWREDGSLTRTPYLLPFVPFIFVPSTFPVRKKRKFTWNYWKCLFVGEEMHVYVFVRRFCIKPAEKRQKKTTYFTSHEAKDCENIKEHIIHYFFFQPKNFKRVLIKASLRLLWIAPTPRSQTRPPFFHITVCFIRKYQRTTPYVLFSWTSFRMMHLYSSICMYSFEHRNVENLRNLKFKANLCIVWFYSDGEKNACHFHSWL